jgi:hypothetical protein
MKIHMKICARREGPALSDTRAVRTEWKLPGTARGGRSAAVWWTPFVRSRWSVQAGVNEARKLTRFTHHRRAVEPLHTHIQTTRAPYFTPPRVTTHCY